MKLSDEQVKRYHEDGYLAVSGVFAPDEVRELQAVTDDFVERSRSVREHTEVFDLEPGHSAEAPRLRRLKTPHQQHPAYDRALRNTTLIELLSQLLGPGIRHQNTKLNLKSPEFGSPVEWHQDWAFYPHTNDDVLAVGVAIDDMTLENGCLMVVPGSHRGPVYDHHANGYFVGAINADQVPDNRAPVELAAGDISIHHARLVHGSAPNRSTRPRRFLLFEYAAADAWPLANFPGWDAFNNRLLRGAETTTPRLEPAPVRIPLPAHERQGSIYEVQSALSHRAFQ